MARHPTDQKADVPVTGREARPKASLYRRRLRHAAKTRNSTTNNEQQDDVPRDGNPTALGGFRIASNRAHFITPLCARKDKPKEGHEKQRHNEANVKSSAPNMRQYSGIRIWSALWEI